MAWTIGMLGRRAILLAVGLVIAIGVIFALFVMEENRKLDDGVVAFKQADYQRALATLEPMANRGNSTARRWVGIAYAFGHGVSRDRNRAQTLISKADPGDAGNIFMFFATEFEEGKNVARDMAEARFWLEQASKAGNEKAKARLAALSTR